MGLFDNEIKLEAIKTLLARKKFEDAAELADEINWARVKDIRMICTVSDLYKKLKRFEDARKLLLVAKKKHPQETAIISSLCELCIKLEEMGQATDYYNEYACLAPEDSGLYVLKYKLAEANGEDAEVRIQILEELKEVKCTPKWTYELAKLYYRAKLTDKCKAECEMIIEQFAESKFAAKAEEMRNSLG